MEISKKYILFILAAGIASSQSHGFEYCPEAKVLIGQIVEKISQGDSLVRKAARYYGKQFVEEITTILKNAPIGDKQKCRNIFENFRRRYVRVLQSLQPGESVSASKVAHLASGVALELINVDDTTPLSAQLLRQALSTFGDTIADTEYLTYEEAQALQAAMTPLMMEMFADGVYEAYSAFTLGAKDDALAVAYAFITIIKSNDFWKETQALPLQTDLQTRMEEYLKNGLKEDLKKEMSILKEKVAQLQDYFEKKYEVESATSDDDLESSDDYEDDETI